MLHTYKKGRVSDKKMSNGSRKKKKVKLGKLVRKLPGGHHGIYESNVGLIRKPLQ